jgi:hypothetical protein
VPQPSVPLNVFQRLIRRWEEVHPYNAAQVLKVSTLPELKRIERAWSDAMETSGLGRVQVDGTIFRHEQLNGELTDTPCACCPRARRSRISSLRN